MFNAKYVNIKNVFIYSLFNLHIILQFSPFMTSKGLLHSCNMFLCKSIYNIGNDAAFDKSGRKKKRKKEIRKKRSRGK